MLKKILTNKWFYIITTLLILLGIVVVQSASIKKLKKDVTIYKHNTETLMTEANQFKIRDSLSAVKVSELSLTLEEYKRYRAADAEIIKDLQIKNKHLKSVNTVQSTMIAELEGRFKDTVIIIQPAVDSLPPVVDSVRYLHIEDPWITLDGYDAHGQFIGTVESRDSLLIASEVQYKRFLGFLWYTSKIKSRSVSVMSKNPHTVVLNTEYIEIRK